MIITKAASGKIIKVLLCIFISSFIVAGFLYVTEAFGISESKLENDIRTSQKIHDDWTVCGDVSDTMAAFVSYPEDRTDHTFSVYVNRPGFSFGYFFRAGGGIFEIEESIFEYTVENYNERAFISMNKQKVERLEIDYGDTVQRIDVDREKPFVFVLPDNIGNISFYNVDGKIVEYH